MYLGKIVEIGSVETIFARPAHPYTRALIEAIPVPDPRQGREATPLEGEAPSPVSPPSGCPFHPRCPFAVAACSESLPVLEAVEGSGGEAGHEHLAACLRVGEI
jgi:oligopeptide/dipeptide ABC transporter ATP-binding protein